MSPLTRISRALTWRFHTIYSTNVHVTYDTPKRWLVLFWCFFTVAPFHLFFNSPICGRTASQLSFKSPSGALPNTLLDLVLEIPQTWHSAMPKYGYSDPFPLFFRRTTMWYVLPPKCSGIHVLDKSDSHDESGSYVHCWPSRERSGAIAARLQQSSVWSFMSCNGTDLVWRNEATSQHIDCSTCKWDELYVAWGIMYRLSSNVLFLFVFTWSEVVYMLYHPSDLHTLTGCIILLRCRVVNSFPGLFGFFLFGGDIGLWLLGNRFSQKRYKYFLMSYT